jgi:integrase
MAKKTSAIIGVNFQFRQGKSCDTYRAWVFEDGKYASISAKVHPTLKKINQHLKHYRLRELTANGDGEFIKLKQRLEQELRSEYGLATYRAIERLDMQTKDFDFEASLEKFYIHKSNTSQPATYRNCVRDFWLPFFLKEKGCIHPNEFIQYRHEAILYVRAAKTRRGEPVSFHSYNAFCKALNQYIKFLLESNVIGNEVAFSIWITATKEEIKRGKLKRKRSTDTYDVNELIEIKKKIDKTFDKFPEKKLQAHGYYFGVITGLRQGNVLGLKAEDLFPDHEIPHFRVSDNVVSGYSRGEKGHIVFENATKTTTQEDEEILLPLLQPSVEIAVEVARFLKSNYNPKDRICPGTPGGFYRVWKRIAKECGFKFLSPHNWKHSYATNGGEHLDEWYKGDTKLLQLCCLHSSYKMTEKYIKKRYPKNLRAWAPNT